MVNLLFGIVLWAVGFLGLSRAVRTQKGTLAGLGVTNMMLGFYLFLLGLKTLIIGLV